MLSVLLLLQYMADDHPENNPWHGVDNGALKDEVNKLMMTSLWEREREIIRLYYGLDNEFLLGLTFNCDVEAIR
ncbi:putative RNA polymerase sigma factor, region [Helianthus anomalus]